MAFFAALAHREPFNLLFPVRMVLDRHPGGFNQGRSNFLAPLPGDMSGLVGLDSRHGRWHPPHQLRCGTAKSPSSGGMIVYRCKVLRNRFLAGVIPTTLMRPVSIHPYTSAFAPVLHLSILHADASVFGHSFEIDTADVVLTQSHMAKFGISEIWLYLRMCLPPLVHWFLP
jgi:hypothetical protein